MGVGVLGMGDWVLGIGDWAQSPIPNPQSPIPNPQAKIEFKNKIKKNKKLLITKIKTFLIFKIN